LGRDRQLASSTLIQAPQAGPSDSIRKFSQARKILCRNGLIDFGWCHYCHPPAPAEKRDFITFLQNVAATLIFHADGDERGILHRGELGKTHE
jgi:hypothetical protein